MADETSTEPVNAGYGPASIVVLARRGDDEHAELVDEFRQRLGSTAHEAGLEVAADAVVVRETSNEQEAAAAASDAVEGGALVVAPIGGDGTINLVLEALDGASTTLLPIPAGTVNLTARVIGVGEGVESAVEALVRGSTRRLDLGRSDDGPFLINASSGYDAAVIGDAADHSEKRFGRLRFVSAGVSRLRRARPQQVRVSVDSAAWFDGKAMSVVVLNFAQRSSPDFEVAPDAEPDDGRLDVAVMRCSSLPRTLMLGVRLALGRRVDPADMLYAQGTTVDVEWSDAVTVQRDGDADDDRRRTLHYGVRPAAITVHVPKDSKTS